jgi:hypothetical protein
VDSFFFGLYKKLNKMGMDCKDLDSLLNSLPWKEKRKTDGTIVYMCTIKEKIKNE